MMGPQGIGDESFIIGIWLKKAELEGEKWPADTMAAYGDMKRN